MRRELEHFYIGNSYGGNQDWFRSFMMRLGGCGAETACDSSLYFALHKGVEGIYPFDKDRLTRKQYVDFAHIMERYLWPRMQGINRPELFVEGYAKYLRDRGIDRISMDVLPGTVPVSRAAEVIRAQIDKGMPVPTLILNHRNRALHDYEWHWFLINGYDISESSDNWWMMVKTVTYSSAKWLDLKALWETGYAGKGGLVLYSLDEDDPGKVAK